MNKNDKSYLAEQPLNSLLLKLSLPAFVGMVVMAAYNIVDTIFVGHGVGPLAIAGLTIIFPIQMINTALAIALGLGGASIISRRLGEKNFKAARDAAGNALSLSVLTGLLLSYFGWFFLDEVLFLFGATVEIMPYAMDYFSIVLFGSPFISFAMAGNNVIRAEGNAKMAMYTMILSAGTNIILDPIFIFGLNLGIRGAAWATIISQIAAALFVYYYFSSGKSLIRLTIKSLYIKTAIVKEILAIGASSLVRQASGSVVAALVNHLLAKYGGDMAIAAYGLILRVMMFAFMPMFGVVQGVQPIIGYNYGARNFKRVRDSVKLAMKVTTVIAFSAFIIFMFFAEWIYMLFTTNDELITIGSAATRFVMIALPLVGVQMIMGAFFQSLGKAAASLIITTSRQVLYVIPFLMLLSYYLGVDGIWLTFPVADILSLLTASILFYFEWKKLYLKQSEIT
jgi:putative MATE family efflux protein